MAMIYGVAHISARMAAAPLLRASLGSITHVGAGPAFVSGDIHALWLYILAPIVGTSLGGLAYQFIREDEPI